MLGLKDFSVTFPKSPLRVGEIVTVIVKILNGGQEEAILQKAGEEVRMEVANHCHEEIYSLKEVVPPSEEDEAEGLYLRFKFSVRKIGFYVVKIYHRRVPLEGSPAKLEFVATGIDASKTVFLRDSPFMTFCSNYEQELNVQAMDRYENNCDLLNVPLASFEFHLFRACEIDRDDEVPVDGVLFESTKGRGERVVLKVKAIKTGIFRGRLTFNGRTVHNGDFMVLVVSVEESTCFHSIMATGISHWPKFEAKLLMVGSYMPKTIRKVYAHVCSGQIEIGEHFLKIFPIKLAVFRISAMTRIKLEYENDDESVYCLTFTDRIQTPVTMEMKAVTARIMLSLYSHYLRKRIGGSESFEGKQRVFYRLLKDIHEEGRYTRRSLRVCRDDIIDSTIRATRGYISRDWCKNFRIEFKNERGIDGGGLRREWLNKLCKLFFGDSPDGMFASMGNSGLVHPVSVHQRNAKWKLHHYRLAGTIVGKCLYETAHGDAYRQMVNARFTRSFLGQIVGLQPNYGYFEEDDPELYSTKIKYILSHDVAELELNFTDEDYSADGKLVKVVDLVANGSKVAVTNENKEQYLNLVAKYRLVTKVQKETEMFLVGLHEIVPEDLLFSFEEKELETLMCGKHEFDVDDLRMNSISANWQFDGDSKKILDWFWTAIARMTESEKEKLLEFTTGSALLPSGGFKSLYPHFNIEFSPRKIGSLPTAVTCVNRISLADHNTFESFEKALKIAIEEGNEGFGFG